MVFVSFGEERKRKTRSKGDGANLTLMCRSLNELGLDSVGKDTFSGLSNLTSLYDLAFMIGDDVQAKSFLLY